MVMVPINVCDAPLSCLSNAVDVDMSKALRSIISTSEDGDFRSFDGRFWGRTELGDRVAESERGRLSAIWESGLFLTPAVSLSMNGAMRAWEALAASGKLEAMRSRHTGPFTTSTGSSFSLGRRPRLL
jgi:hypothetical protein